jgi:outer membrane lipoprotein-sorting protein
LRKKHKNALVVAALLFSWFFIISSSVRAADVNAEIMRVQKAYSTIKDLKGSFIQKSLIKDLDKTETYRGEFYIKPPLRMKWIYGGKNAQSLTINGDTVLIYKKAENQAYKSKFDRQTYGQTPVALLSGFGNIRDEFVVSGGGDSLVLKPRKPMGNVTFIKMTLSVEGFPIRGFEIHDSYSNVITIEISGVKINTGLKDSLFDLALPKGVNVFEQ